MRALIIALLLLFPVSVMAEVTSPKPPGIQATVIPDYNVTAAIWWTGSGIGYFPAIFELRASDNKWVMVLDIDYGIQEPELTTRLLGACGCKDINFAATIYTNAVVIAKANEALKRRYPPIISTPGPTPTDSYGALNFSLADFVIKSVNGIVTLSPR